MPAERLARMHIRQVHLDERDRHRRQRVAQRHAGVGEGGRVDHDEGGAVGARGVDALDQQVLGIGLHAAQAMPGRLRLRAQARINLRQGGAPVHGGFAFAQEIEVGTVKNEDIGHRCASPGEAQSERILGALSRR